VDERARGEKKEKRQRKKERRKEQSHSPDGVDGGAHARVLLDLLVVAVLVGVLLLGAVDAVAVHDRLGVKDDLASEDVVDGVGRASGARGVREGREDDVAGVAVAREGHVVDGAVAAGVLDLSALDVVHQVQLLPALLLDVAGAVLRREKEREKERKRERENERMREKEKERERNREREKREKGEEN